MIMSTTPTLEGRKIKDYLGVVTGEAILGANVFKDFFASITDIVGGRSGAYEKELAKARKMALDEAQQQAITEKDYALSIVKKKKGSVTVNLGTRETGKSELSYRLAEFFGRRTYAVSPEQRPPSWIQWVSIKEVEQKVLPYSTLIFDDLPAYASNRDYNDLLVQEMERLIPMCRHKRALHLIFNSQSSAQADRYILDCELAFLKPLGILMDDVERPNIRRIYRNEVDPYFEKVMEQSSDPELAIKKHAWMRSRYWKGGVEIAMVPRSKEDEIIEGEIVEISEPEEAEE